jgi:hypothetical protein
MFLLKMEDTGAKRLRGRSAIQAAHGSMSGGDEARLDTIISNIYGVDSNEAAEIHLNYHIDRILAALTRRAREKDTREDVLTKRLEYLDVYGTAYQVAKGKLTEVAAIDALFRALHAMENPDKHDRYMNFYG